MPEPNRTGKKVRVNGPVCVEAELFDRRMTTGRSRPVLVAARGASGAVECVVKLDAWLTVPPREHLFEWVAFALARVLKINVPPAYEVQITREFAEAIEDPAVRAAAMTSLGGCFGSQHVPAMTQVPRDYPMPSELVASASNIVAFDIFIHNVDRRRENPNLLMNRNVLLAIDHGDAFAFTGGLIGAPDPVEDHLPTVIEGHPLREPLRGRMGSLQGFAEALGLLTDDILAGIVAATPPAWQTGYAAGKIESIVDVLKRRRDAAPKWLPKVEACVR